MRYGKLLSASLLSITLMAPLPALAQQAPSDASSPTSASSAPAAASASSAPDVAPPALSNAAPPATTTIENPYGLSALWKNGDFIAKGTLVILAIFSAATWYILVTKLLEQSQLLSQARKSRNFWSAGSVSDGINALPKKGAFRAVAVTGISALEHHEGSLVENIDLNTWITLSIQRTVEQIISRLQGGLAVLATVGSTAPFIGLFGTVWGIYHALTAIGIAGQASIDKVAGPVGEALIMTALGLATAVPAVLGYNWLVRRNKTAIESVRGFASDLHSLLVSGKVAGRSQVAGDKPETAGRASIALAAKMA